MTPFGPIVNDVEGMGAVHELIGGKGSSRWKQLINGMHLTGPWNCIEYVVLPPGSSCGEHTHRATEEIYYILAGSAVMHIDGERVDVQAGDVITETIGAAHTIANHGDRDMEMYVIEVFPGDGEAAAPRRLPLGQELEPAAGFRDSSRALRCRTVDLAPLFSGAWGRFSVLEVPPGAALDTYALDDRDEVLFINRGAARLYFDGRVVEGVRGLCAGIPPGTPRSVENRSATEPLELLIAEVFADAGAVA
jgi:mannose-6-phosphate isomerase-like protein (cupin superfamily)